MTGVIKKKHKFLRVRLHKVLVKELTRTKLKARGSQ
jgi:hypothetical protein